MSYSVYGYDPNGRKILATPYAAKWLDDFIEACQAHGFTPTIVQGAFMASLGGGAKASAGVHDLAGCYDFRVWDRTADQVAFMVREGRRRGGIGWVRDKAHGNMDPHFHVVIAGDAPLSDGARDQIEKYKAGYDGLVGKRPDYHWRPSPLVLDWKAPVLKKTPNITAARAAKTREARKAALRRVIAHGDAAAVKWAKAWLASITAMEATEKKASAAAKALAGLEVK